MRKQLLGLLVPLLTFVLIAAAADMTGKGVAASARLQRLEVTDSQDGLRVEFTAKGAAAPKVTTLESPARIVVDFPNTVMATAQSRISVGRDGVKDVRVGMDGQVPPNTRVVVDLAGSRQHELVASPDGGFILQIANRDAVRAHGHPAAPAKSVTAAPKLALVSVPAAAVPATAVAPAPALTEKPAEFTFVE